MERVQRVLKIRPGEGPTAFRFLTFMVVVWTGFAIGGAGVEGLLFARSGPETLPFLYIALGVLTFLAMTTLGLLLRGSAPDRVLVALPLGFAGVVLIMRAVAGLRGIDPVLWLLMMVMWTAQGVAVWGLASTLHDTRQAKRLFPLYGAGWILGSVVGGLATRPLALWIHAENLLLVWAGSLVAAFFIARPLGGSGQAHRRRLRRSPGGTARHVGPLEEVRAAVRLVRGSPLLLWMAASLALFAFLYFVLTLVFAEAATARFPASDRLAGFLGLVMAVSNGVGFLTALLLANRLFARFGLVSMVLTLPVIYLTGFAVVSVTGTFLAVVTFRLIQLVWVNGIWASAWQSLFNVVPPEHRHRARTFMDGVALQAGIVAAGILLIAADRFLDPSDIALIGVGAAAVAALAVWRARAAYGGAVVGALRAGNPEVFFVEDEPFGGFRQDGAARALLIDGAAHPDPAVRRTAVEILAETGGAGQILVAALRDVDSGVRAAAARGVARGHEAGAVPELIRLLRDADPAVRAAAVGGLSAVAAPEMDLAAELEPLLADGDPTVRARAAATLVRRSRAVRARAVLLAMAASDDAEHRAIAVATLGELGEGLEAVAVAAADADPSVRRASASALGGFDAEAATEPLLGCLGDPAPTVRDAAVDSAVRFGPRLVGALIDALADTAREPGAVRALARLQDRDGAGALRRYAASQVAAALRYHDLWRRIDADGDDRFALVRSSMRQRALRHAGNAFRAMPGDPAGVELAIENLASDEPVQRANALEAMEALGEPDTVRPLLAVWETDAAVRADPGVVLLELLDDDDPWLRACAAAATTTAPDGRFDPMLERIARTDPDPTARQAAEAALKGGHAVETLSTLPLMERVLFLRKVPLFGELAPIDLKHVAASATEHVYPDGEAIAVEGDVGDEMHLVVSGQIRVLVGRHSEEVALRRPGDCVGEMAVISEEPRMATLVASGDVRTLSIDRKRFQRILRERPEASLAVMRVLCDRLRESHARAATRVEP